MGQLHPAETIAGGDEADLDSYSGRFEPHDSAGEKPKE
jgi:hypothetical protein